MWIINRVCLRTIRHQGWSGCAVEQVIHKRHVFAPTGISVCFKLHILPQKCSLGGKRGVQLLAILHECNHVVISTRESSRIGDSQWNVLTEVVCDCSTAAGNRGVTHEREFVLEFLNTRSAYVTGAGAREIDGSNGSNVNNCVGGCHHSTAQGIGNADGGNAGIASSVGVDYDRLHVDSGGDDRVVQYIDTRETLHLSFLRIQNA